MSASSKAATQMSGRAGRSRNSRETMMLDSTSDAAMLLAAEERRETKKQRIIGHLVSLTGVHGLIACEMSPEESGDHWSVGSLISIVHANSRLVGVVCELVTSNSRWRPGENNVALIKIEISGEIIDESPGMPIFHRGIHSFPTLGAIAHRIRAADLRAIYSIRGVAGVEIGRLTQNPTIPATVNVKELVSRHFAVVGSTGVGKTTAVSMLLKQCLRERPNLRVMIIDPHNEYAAHFPKDSVVFDSDNLELPYWMFKFDEMVDIIYAGRKPNPDESDALYEVIKSAKTRFAAASAASRLTAVRRPSVSENGWVSADTPVPYRISDAVLVIEEWMGKLDPRYARADMRALKHRFEALSHDPRFRFMFGKVVVEDIMTKVVSQIFRMPKDGAPVTIVKLAGLPNEVVNSVVSVLARMAFEIALWSDSTYEIALLCEEAHRYIPADLAQGFLPTRQAIGRIAKEGRKYGASLGVVTQRPSELDPTVLSQCSTMFAMRLANERDKGIISAAVGVSSEGTISFLSSIADREAIAFGEAIATPMRMKFGDYRRFEQDRVASAAAPEEDAEKARNDLRAIVGRMRGEYQGDAAALRQPEPELSRTGPSPSCGMRHEAVTRAVGSL
jgi:DNA helicase HerA-like ATPase